MQYQLDARQQAIIPIVAFTATGQMEKLDVALNAGLDAGLTLSEVKEILLQLYAYCGFPRSLNGLSCYARTVFDECLARTPQTLFILESL